MTGGSLDCRTALGLLGRWYDHDLPPEEAAGFEEHLVVCPPCRVEVQHLRTALGALRSAAGRPDAAAGTALPGGPAAPAGGRYWKFLRGGGTSPFAAFPWPALEGRWAGGGEPVPCRAGIHACRLQDLPYWLDEELWTIELDQVVAGRHKVVAARGRLGDQVEAWTPDTARELSLACLRRTVEHAAAELRAAAVAELSELAAGLTEAAAGGPTVQLAAAAGEASGAAARQGRRGASRLCLYVVDAVEYIDLPVATVAYIAARAANERTDPGAGEDPYGDERAWQAGWLVNRLQLAGA